MPKQCCKDFFASIPDDEPVFTLAARDLTAPTIIQNWIEDARAAGTNEDKLERAEQHLCDFEQFQKEHPDRCKIPD